MLWKAIVHQRESPLGDQERQRVLHLAIRLSGYFDESGKFKDHKVIAFCGLLSPVNDWYALQVEWDSLLRRYGISSLHMSGGVLNFKRGLSKKRPALGKEERIKVIRQFILAIKKNIEVGIAPAVDVQGYNSLPSHFKNEIGGEDPYYWAFSCAMAGVLEHLNAVPGSKTTIACDDEEKYFIQCYKLLAKFKLREPILRDKFISMCAGDDREFPQLQAADLLAYITRSEAEYRFLNKPYEFRELYQELAIQNPGEKLTFGSSSVFWTRDAFLAWFERESKKRKRKK
jgi:hypothetical protein